MDLIQEIDSLDKEIVWVVNNNQTEFMDYVMVFFSHKWMPIPIYLLLLYLLYKQLGWKKTLFYILPSIALVIALSDITASKIFKPYFERLRPCHEMPNLHLVTKCGGQFGFFSSHAANSFGVATLIFLLLRKKQKHIGLLLFLWAIPVSFSRVYLAVHYPSDIFAGMLCGLFFGTIIFMIVSKVMETKFNLHAKKTKANTY